MARIFPFRAVRPTRDKVSLVSSRPYGDYSHAEMAAQLTYNPLSFLHILNPAYSDPQKTTAEDRFRKVNQKYHEFKSENVLVQDEKPSIYIHKIVTPEHIFVGLICATSIEDYQSDVIKKHEDTISYRVEWLKDYMKFAGFNTEPVLMTYRDDKLITDWLIERTAHPAEFEFSTTKNDIHFLWRIDDESELEMLRQRFEEIGDIYIADGHHRSASAELLNLETGSSKPNTRNFMSFLIADSNVRIYEFNRLIKHLNGLTKETFLNRCSEDFLIENKGSKIYQPAQKNEFALYIENEFYSLKLRDGRINFRTLVDSLDTHILYERILKPLIGITDLRNDDRIEYIPGIKPISRLKACVDDGSYAMAFLLYPITIDEIRAVADANLIMPPKSTYIEPKFRSGLVVYEI